MNMNFHMEFSEDELRSIAQRIDSEKGKHTRGRRIATREDIRGLLEGYLSHLRSIATVPEESAFMPK